MKQLIVDRENIVVTADRTGIGLEDRHIPYRLVDILVLAAPTTLATKTLLKLSAERIPVLVISKDNRQFALTLPLEAKNGELKMRQYVTVANRRLAFASYYLEEKIRSHCAHLGSLGVAIEEKEWLDKISRATQLSELLGIEGSFSRIYFRHFFSLLPATLHKGKRSKRPPQDPINAILSYLYSMLYNFIAARLAMFGFDPSLSYLHEPFRSHFALASDILEKFRANANRQTMAWFHHGHLKASDFSKKGGVWLRYESRKKLWPDVKRFLSDTMPEVDDEIALLRSAIS